MALWKVLLMVIALICALHTTSVHGGRETVVGYPAPRPAPYRSTGCPKGSKCDPPAEELKKKRSLPNRKMKLLRLHVAAALLALAAATTAGAVTYQVNNQALSTAGRRAEYGAVYAEQVLAAASSFTWSIFKQTSPANRRSVDTVVLAVRDVDGIAFTSGNTITLGAGYVADITGNDFKTQVTGVLYHEVVHVWQWGLQDYAAHSWVYEGIADFVRLRAGYIAAGWVQPGQGNSWEDSYSVTARFFDYCDGVEPGFVADMNGKLEDGYNVDYFVQITGKTVQQLWQDYKAKYGN
uniref:Uncharacterized protein n=2 Tax=Oryza punctata TaxID=4537 RepID=A0A0E0M938_ORYPU